MTTVARNGSFEVDEGLVSSRPPTGYTVVGVWTLDTVRDLLNFRSALKRHLSDGAKAGPTLGPIATDVVLAASELATNGLRHGIGPTSVQLSRRGDNYLLDVVDHNVTSEPRIVGTRAPGRGGFGLRIVRRVAAEFGWYRSDATKHVWACFPALHTVTRY